MARFAFGGRGASPPPAVLVRVVDVDHLPPGRGGGKETAIGAT